MRQDAGPSVRPVTPVTILAAELAALADDLEPVVDLPAGAMARMHRARDLAAGLDPYLSRSTSPESAALGRLAERTRDADWGTGTLEAEMLSGHVEGRFLQILVRVTRARRVLEIGMFTGYSALAMAEALPEGGRLVACEIDPDVAAFARRSFDGAPGGEKISIVVGPASVTLVRLAASKESFELVFIDADKSGYAAYLDLLLEHGLLAPGGLICVDNTLLQGEPYLEDQPSGNGGAIAAFNQRVADDQRLDQVLLPLRDGVTLIRRAGDP